MATNCFILSNQKLWYGTQFLHKNKVKWRILQAGRLKQSIKKDMFSIVSKININLFGSGREEYSLHPPNWLRACILVTKGGCFNHITEKTRSSMKTVFFIEHKNRGKFKTQ